MQQIKDIKTLKFVNLALMASILVYVGVCVMLATQNGWTSNFSARQEGAALIFLMPFMSIISLLIAVNIPKFIKSPNPEPQGPEVKSSIFLNFDPYTNWAQTVTITRLALAESVAIFGLMLSFMNQDLAWIFPYALVALFFQYLLGPLKSSS